MVPVMEENHHTQAQGFWLQQVSPKHEPLGPRQKVALLLVFLGCPVKRLPHWIWLLVTLWL